MCRQHGPHALAQSTDSTPQRNASIPLSHSHTNSLRCFSVQSMHVIVDALYVLVHARRCIPVRSEIICNAQPAQCAPCACVDHYVSSCGAAQGRRWSEAMIESVDTLDADGDDGEAPKGVLARAIAEVSNEEMHQSYDRPASATDSAPVALPEESATAMAEGRVKRAGESRRPTMEPCTCSSGKGMDAATECMRGERGERQQRRISCRRSRECSREELATCDAESGSQESNTDSTPLPRRKKSISIDVGYTVGSTASTRRGSLRGSSLLTAAPAEAKDALSAMADDRMAAAEQEAAGPSVGPTVVHSTGESSPRRGFVSSGEPGLPVSAEQLSRSLYHGRAVVPQHAQQQAQRPAVPLPQAQLHSWAGASACPASNASKRGPSRRLSSLWGGGGLFTGYRGPLGNRTSTASNIDDGDDDEPASRKEFAELRGDVKTLLERQKHYEHVLQRIESSQMKAMRLLEKIHVGRNASGGGENWLPM